MAEVVRQSPADPELPFPLLPPLPSWDTSQGVVKLTLKCFRILR